MQFILLQNPLKKRKGFESVEDLSKSQTSRCILLGMTGDEFLVFGHTHRPFLDGENRVVNSGSWVQDAAINNTFVIIDDGKITLNQWINNQIKEISSFEIGTAQFLNN